jgi:hypothetical protein
MSLLPTDDADKNSAVNLNKKSKSSSKRYKTVVSFLIALHAVEAVTIEKPADKDEVK